MKITMLKAGVLIRFLMDRTAFLQSFSCYLEMDIHSGNAEVRK